MSLANFDLDLVREKIAFAYEADSQLFEQYREYARRLKQNIRKLRKYSVDAAVSFVAADGGSNRIVFNPGGIELVQVVDSRGRQRMLDALSRSTRIDELEEYIRRNEDHPLSKLCGDLGMRVGDLSDLLKKLGAPEAGTVIHGYREIVEWAVLYELVTNQEIQWATNTIIVRDGLLRSLYFRRNVFRMIAERMKRGIEGQLQKNVCISLVGVAKHSTVLDKLAVALELEGAFHKRFPCYVQVTRDIEKECYSAGRPWVEPYEVHDAPYNTAGRMYLVKFGDRPMDPVWLVDVANWQEGEVERILGQLMVDAQQGFPIPDYPMCIQRAHDFARVSNLQVDVLQDLVIEGMSQKLTQQEFERLLRMKYLGQNLAALRYKEA